MTPPLVSVLLPARDAAATIASALASVRRQTLTAWECIVVDDASRDETAAVAAAAAGRDARIRVVPGRGAGIAAALQAGLAACRGRWVARMDADDVMHRERLARQVAALEADPSLAAVGARVRIFPRAGLRDGWRAYERWLDSIDTPERVRAEAFVENPLVHPTLCARREVLERFGWRACGWPEDYDLVLRMLAAGLRLAVVPARLLAWRDGPARLTRAHPDYALERITACKAHHLARGLLAGTDRYVLWGYGDTGRALRQALAAEGKRPSHVIELHPGRLGQTIHGAPVVPPEALVALPRGPLVASVAGLEARTRIRAFLDRLGWRETAEYVCAA
ncbi:MAG TPA: glycosyltransferase family 2 protein [Candidatus Limnocylindria bacterium]|nr:glycosyltransferase family 2 protein [Candidatus Limnocylindria bacterium]